MGEVSLKLIPTVNSENTETLNESGISSCNLIRFMSKLPQKLGGWNKFYPYAMNGIPKALHGWADLNAVNHLAVGTTQELAVITNNVEQLITPQTLVSSFAPNFSTTINTATVGVTDPNINTVTTFDSVFFNTPISIGGVILEGTYSIPLVTGVTSYNIVDDQTATSTVPNAGAVPVFTPTSGSATVSVALTGHGLATGDAFTFPIATTSQNVTVMGTYDVTVINANTFTIAASTQANGSTPFSMNGGQAQLVYYISLGPQAAGIGYGLGPYGAGGYGTGVVPTSQTGTPITATNWTLDNWGEILLACPYNGGIYYWSPNGGFLNATLVAAAPIFNRGIFVAMPAQILVAYGSIASGEQQNPLTVRWSDQEDFTNWTVTSTTQAGSFRIPTGSEIVGALQGPQQALIWTDLDVWAMQYLGPPLVFGFNKISSGCGLIGPHAVINMRGNVYWMSNGNFFVSSGNGVQEIPCSVWDIIFQNLDTTNQRKCIAAANSAFDEVSFYYPSLTGGTGEIDSYVKYNITEGSWDYGSLARTAWIDQSVLGQPIGGAPNGLLYQHETSLNADGQPLNWFFETGYFVLTEGQDLAFVDWFFPDMKFGLNGQAQNATVYVTITVVNYPNDTPQVFGPFVMTKAVNYVNTRLRGRQIKLKFSGNDLNSFVRLGNMRYRVAKDGRR